MKGHEASSHVQNLLGLLHGLHDCAGHVGFVAGTVACPDGHNAGIGPDEVRSRIGLESIPLGKDHPHESIGIGPGVEGDFFVCEKGLRGRGDILNRVWPARPARNGHQLKGRLGRQSSGNSHETRQFAAAWAAPCAPKVENCHFPRKRGWLP